MDDNVVKSCVVCNTKKVLMISLMKLKNVKSVILKGSENDILIKKDHILPKQRDK